MRINIISKEKQIYEECKENGQWQKSIEFKLPIIENNEREFAMLKNKALKLLRKKMLNIWRHKNDDI